MFSAAGKSAVTSGYNINNSLRFRSSASAYLSRTPASAGNRKTFTISFWFKRGSLGSDIKFLSAWNADSDNGNMDFRLTSGNILYWGPWSTGITTTAVFRDPTAWYHVVLAIDTTQATGANRHRIYVNGVEYTFSGTAVTQNTDLAWNNTVAHNIGRNIRTSGDFFDGYMADFYSIDGSALTPSSFGETDGTTGVWKPKKYGGSFGTNGFYLPFSDIATTSGSNAGLGKDFSGNGNYWTTNNISVTSGVTYDARLDSPTLTSTTIANHCTFNPLLYQNGNTTGLTLADGNLTVSRSTNAYGGYGSTMTVPTSGKYALKFKFSGTIGASVECYMGVAVTSAGGLTLSGSTTGNPSNYYTMVCIQGGGGQVQYNKAGAGEVVHYNPSVNVANNDEFEFLIDRTNGTVDIKKNGSTYGTQITGMPSTQEWFPYVSMYGTQTIYFINNFTPSDSSYQVLNTFNLPTSTIVKGNLYMDATAYTGTNGSPATQVISSNFQPDFLWFKKRSGAYDHALIDSVRGINKQLYSNLYANAEGTDGDVLSAIGSTKIGRAHV